MTAAVPAARPRMSRAELINAVLAKHPGYSFKGKVTVVGVRGYYRDTLGAVGKNDRAIYDDALFIVTDDAFVAFNGNTDPSGYRVGSGFGAGKGMASLKAGAYAAHHLGKHKGQYEALIQTAGPVTVTRDGKPPYDNTGGFGINIHRGGVNGTSSEGCQTIPPAQWPAFIATVTDQVRRLHPADWRKAVVHYVLLEGLA